MYEPIFTPSFAKDLLGEFDCMMKEEMSLGCGTTKSKTSCCHGVIAKIQELLEALWKLFGVVLLNSILVWVSTKTMQPWLTLARLTTRPNTLQTHHDHAGWQGLICAFWQWRERSWTFVTMMMMVTMTLLDDAATVDSKVRHTKQQSTKWWW